MESVPVRRALISVSSKMGLTEFARGLASSGVEIFSTGGTRRHLEGEGIAVRDVSEYTGFPEMMDGRLKTLHPKVHGGILCRHDNPQDMEALASQGIETFELVVVSLYPFQATIAREGVTMEEAIEQIDIGGPTLIRAAAKNHAFTTVATDPEQYGEILQQIQADGRTTFELRRSLAGAAFEHTAIYDRSIADYFACQQRPAEFPCSMHLPLHRKGLLRYGENPHQKAAVYALGKAEGPNLVSARQLNGKELSYNNLLDLDSALGIVRLLSGPSVSVIKHNNPCGAATADTLAEALRNAMAGDPLSAFGSVVGTNRPFDAACAEVLCEPGLFVEAIVAPGFDDEAVEILTTRPKWKANVRLMDVGDLEIGHRAWTAYRQIDGGMLVQEADVQPDPEDQWTVPTEAQPTEEQLEELRFAWQIVRHVKSNAIVLCKDRMLLGAGAGQMSRVDSVEIAIKKAGDRAAGSVLASDAFFPFPDSIHRAAQAGVAAVVQPGGSRKDDEVVAACNEHGLPMVFTGRRHFKH